MPKPTTAYIFANEAGRIRFGVTKDLGFELEQLRTTPGWETAGCVWWKDFSSLANANVWVKSFRRAGPHKRRQLVQANNPKWVDISGVPPKVVAGIPTLNTQSELTLLYEKVRSIRKKLWLMGYPDDFDSWDELDKAEWQMAREDERGESDGGVGAVRLGWPDFPRPRVGADAKAWPLE